MSPRRWRRCRHAAGATAATPPGPRTDGRPFGQAGAVRELRDGEVDPALWLHGDA
eukprot:gene15265-15810_t